MPTLIIGNQNYSSWSLRPWILLKHAGIAFDTRRIGLFTDTFKAEITQYSEAGKVPVYQDGGLTLWESLAICEYVAELRPELWPDEPQARAIARAVCSEMHAGFNALRNELPMNCRARNRRISITDQCRADIDRVESIWRQCREQYGSEGPWLFDRYSVADAFFAPVVLRFQAYELTLTEETHAYCQTVLADPHLQQWISAGRAESEVLAEDEAGEDP
ncbi:glutathione S-transferase family protein [Motiliproteus sediminis]|uniref:glutathione S-transferase family protein n=1 Tax=Motiliproteus sediminis TaxID=1468178 RepID=UPI001AEF47B0|nr:glutathione S-transferase family protein [Motiliproteus sediminis]